MGNPKADNEKFLDSLKIGEGKPLKPGEKPAQAAPVKRGRPFGIHTAKIAPGTEKIEAAPTPVLSPPPQEVVDNVAIMVKTMANMLLRTDRAKELEVTDAEAKAFAYPTAQLIDYYTHLKNPIYLVWGNFGVQLIALIGSRIIMIKKKETEQKETEKIPCGFCLEKFSKEGLPEHIKVCPKKPNIN